MDVKKRSLFLTHATTSQMSGTNHTLNFPNATAAASPTGQRLGSNIERVDMSKLSLDESFVNIGDIQNTPGRNVARNASSAQSVNQDKNSNPSRIKPNAMNSANKFVILGNENLRGSA